MKKSKYIFVDTINFSKYIFDNFDRKDKIVLKIDIEGEEYNMLEDMIRTGSIYYINYIFCEWHYKKIGSIKNYLLRKYRHDCLVEKLNKLGFNLEGNNRKDELSYVINNKKLLRKYFNESKTRNI